MNKIVLTTASVLTLALLSRYSSHDVTIAPKQPQNYEVLGKAEGSATGSLGLISTAYNFVPMGPNTRTQKAYADALERVPGSTGLINVTYQEDWV